MSNSKEYKLSIPGPIDMDPDVLNKMAEPMMPHFGQEWADEYAETVTLTKELFQTSGEVYIFPGSGSAALDMGIGNLTYNDKSVLVLRNGFFGERLEEISRGFTPNVDVLDFGFAVPFDIDKIKEALAKKKYDVLMSVHVETSIGIANPVKQLAGLVKDSDTVFLVDGVSAVGVEPLYMDDWGVDVCVTASQKGLESPPGLGIVAFNEKAWKLMETVNRPDWYLNLKVWKRWEKHWGPLHPQLVTHAVPTVRAMTLALKKILKDGYASHIEAYEEATEYFRAEVLKLGYELYIEKDYAHGLTAIAIPDEKSQALMDFFKTKHNTLIGGGLGPSKGKVVRIGHMGIGRKRANLESIVEILKIAKKELAL